MAFDALVLHAVVHELQPEVVGARINKIHQPDAHTLILRYYGPAGQGKLLLSAHPQRGRLHKTMTSRDNPAKAPLFAMVMRKWLEGAKITALEATLGERVATLRCDARDELGDIIPLSLILEIMGKHSNLILVAGDGQIIDGIRRYGSALSRYREVLPGRPYREPPPMRKLPLPPADEAELAAALYQRADHSLPEALTAAVGGLSPLLAEHIILVAGGDPRGGVEQLGEYEISRIWQALRELGLLRDQCRFTPTLLSRNGQPADYAAILPAQWRDLPHRAAESMNLAVEALAAAQEAAQEFRQKQQALAKSLRQHIARLSRKISLQEADLGQCEAAESDKQAGDLLAANLWQLRPGMSEVSLPAFDDPARMITLDLDPARSPQENVQACYRRYSKAKSARGRIEQQLTANRAELDYVLSIEQAMQDSEQLEELEAVMQEAAAAGYVRPAAPPARPQRKGQERQPAAPLPPRRYVSDDGFTVLIGRNNRQNDRLSLRQAQDDDIWLHTQKIPGSHVIVVSEGREVPEATLLEAAGWAAWFSKARDSAQVPVDYLPAGKLKKPPGSPPGYVIYNSQRTLYVRPQAPPAEQNQA